MDPVTHLTSGALAGQALRGKIQSRLVLPFCVLAAWIPDIDNFMGLGPEAYLLHHRGVTHSIFGALGLALILAGIFRLFSKNFSLGKAFAVAYALILVHIYLDLITSFGTQILAPFTRTRFALSSVFIIDPFLTLPGLLVFVLSLFLKVRRKQAAVLGLAFMLLYPMACLGVRHVVKVSLADRPARENIGYEKLDVTTALLSPLYWKVVVDDGQSLRTATISLVPGAKEPLVFEDFPKADEALLEKLGETESLFATWSWFAVYPVMENSGTETGREIVFRDLRFYGSAPLMKRLSPDRRVPFTLTAFLDARGELTGYRYSHPGKSVVYSVSD